MSFVRLLTFSSDVVGEPRSLLLFQDPVALRASKSLSARKKKSVIGEGHLELDSARVWDLTERKIGGDEGGERLRGLRDAVREELHWLRSLLNIDHITLESFTLAHQSKL